MVVDAAEVWLSRMLNNKRLNHVHMLKTLNINFQATENMCDKYNVGFRDLSVGIGSDMLSIGTYWNWTQFLTD